MWLFRPAFSSKPRFQPHLAQFRPRNFPASSISLSFSHLHYTLAFICDLPKLQHSCQHQRPTSLHFTTERNRPTQNHALKIVTVGLGEGLAIASLTLQLVEVGQKCGELIKDFRSFREAASELSPEVKHKLRKIDPIRNILLKPDKFGLGKTLFKMLDLGCQRDVRDILFKVVRLLEVFRGVVEKYHLD